METEVDVFDVLSKAVQASFANAVKLGGGALFTTDTQGLFKIYLSGFDDPVERQYHNCSCCRQFLDRVGSLVFVDAKGERHTAMWEIDEKDVPDHFKKSVKLMRKVVDKAKITGVYHSKEAIWGTPVTGEWTHFNVKSPNVYTNRGVLTAGQKMAEQKQEFDMLRRGLDEFHLATFQSAVTLLSADQLYRSDKFLGLAEALRDLKQATQSLGQRDRDCLLWKAVATQPAGFCHVRSSMIGTLLADLESGMAVDDVKKSFDAKMHPMRYQRAQAAPTAGNIQQAEKLFASMGLEPALKRRLATLMETESYARWVANAAYVVPATPAVATKKDSVAGAFAHLKAPTAADSAAISGFSTISWKKFRDTVLPKAQKIEFKPPVEGQPYGAITTACQADAPPLFAWDKEKMRNPFSWYKWQSVPAKDFGLTVGAAHQVLMVVDVPASWIDGDSSAFQGAVFVLEGALDQNLAQAGLGLYPEGLLSELRPVRSTIEAHSNSGVLEVLPNMATASGVVLRKGPKIDLRVKVHTKNGTIDYAIDRWE